ncbi:hypothetical protein TBLA_0B05210 [Henningerozyma blattae CBS 6284]|uniref:RRM domain-containing protein n=1 Tax=Henningerozyma blattae (strain ATCC 34711 / CBS 6284 / DSM 70876 / NBRC 10599 / NRRL Y-10934 / UCD 77-7) TaxID=1071380 RepID=I2GZ01_HENB6|nr:hypothetical protein TBLA_0B05210 [Tetrapisispora blattae CBS 6284]CCH59353.1 hypothetical protein TBLA_0B05210 [Tetrapisispora blattae CBS 6284]
MIQTENSNTNTHTPTLTSINTQKNNNLFHMPFITNSTTNKNTMYRADSNTPTPANSATTATTTTTTTTTTTGNSNNHNNTTWNTTIPDGYPYPYPQQMNNPIPIPKQLSFNIIPQEPTDMNSFPNRLSSTNSSGNYSNNPNTNELTLNMNQLSLNNNDPSQTHNNSLPLNHQPQLNLPLQPQQLQMRPLDQQQLHPQQQHPQQQQQQQLHQPPIHQQLPPFDNNGDNMRDEPPYMMASVAAATIANPNTSIQTSTLPNNNTFGNTPSRTVYLGNIPSDLSVKDLLDHVRSGVVENIKILPDKMCAFISFVDESSALLFHSDAILKRLNIGGRDIKIGWGKPTPIDPIVATSIVTDGATRNVYIGQLSNSSNNNTSSSSSSTSPSSPSNNTSDDLEKKKNIDDSPLTEEKLREDLKDYGEIDCVKIVQDKGFAFVHMSSILSAIKVVNNLAQTNPYYQNKRIFYGKDRCAFITKTQQHNAAQFLGVQPGMEHLVQFSDREFISNTLLQQSAAAAAIATSAGGPNNLGNRTVYLGNLPVDVKIDEICNAVRGGLLQHIKLLTDRHVCFVTFIDPTAAAQFYAMSSLHGLSIQKKRCKVGWGKHSGPLPNLIALAVSNGASRNVYLGNIDFENDIKLHNPPIFTELSLRNIFQQYGDVEQINFLPEKNCCFINFTNISNAILAIEKIKNNPDFKDLKINFGKDRCGNIPHQVR